MYHTHFESQREQHEGHETDIIETIYDNPVEYTAWYRCYTCKVNYMDASVEICEEEPLMFIVLSSFAQIRPLKHAMRDSNIAVRSVASYAPRDFDPKLSIPEFAPLNDDGSRFRIRDHGTPDDFYQAMHDRLQFTGIDGAMKLLELHKQEYNGVVLCCWCPGTTTARKQLREHKSFVCHTEPVGWWLEARGFKVVETRENLYHTSD